MKVTDLHKALRPAAARPVPRVPLVSSVLERLEGTSLQHVAWPWASAAVEQGLHTLCTDSAVATAQGTPKNRTPGPDPDPNPPNGNLWSLY